MASTIATYGGALVDAIPVVDPSSEISAASLNRLMSDTAATTQTRPMAVFQFAGSATAPALASTGTFPVGFRSLWGNGSLMLPTFVRTGTGAITVTLPASTTDDLGNTVLLNVSGVRASVMSGTTFGAILPNIVSSNQFTLSMQSGSSASDLAGSLIFVEVF